MDSAICKNGTTEHVFITVVGGVAYLAQAPSSVRVHIIDYDDLKADFQSTFNSLDSQEQSFLMGRGEYAAIG